MRNIGHVKNIGHVGMACWKYRTFWKNRICWKYRTFYRNTRHFENTGHFANTGHIGNNRTPGTPSNSNIAASPGVLHSAHPAHRFPETTLYVHPSFVISSITPGFISPSRFSDFMHAVSSRYFLSLSLSLSLSLDPWFFYLSSFLVSLSLSHSIKRHTSKIQPIKPILEIVNNSP